MLGTPSNKNELYLDMGCLSLWYCFTFRCGYRNYAYFALRKGDHCSCGNAEDLVLDWNGKTRLSSPDKCKKLCPGDDASTCGSLNFLDLYSIPWIATKWTFVKSNVKNLKIKSMPVTLVFNIKCILSLYPSKDHQ